MDDDYLNKISEIDSEYKLVLIGDSTIGKTAFFRKITTGVFNNIILPTVGTDIKSLDFEITTKEEGQDVKKKISIILTDTAGQERYHCLTKTFFKKAKGVLLLYSIIDRRSFEHLTKWLDEIKDKLGNINDNKYLVFLMGTKFDIVKEDKSLRQVNEEEAADFCEENNLMYYGEYSSKDTTQETFKYLFTEFARKLYEKIGMNKIDRKSVSTLSKKKTKKNRKRCGCQK